MTLCGIKVLSDSIEYHIMESRSQVLILVLGENPNTALNPDLSENKIWIMYYRNKN